MQSLQLSDVKDFMGKLLTTELFDAFFVSEASITTFTTFRIDGTFHPDYYGSTAETDNNSPSPRFLTWRLLRPHFFDIVKGRYTPLEFKLIFRLADHNVEKLLLQTGVSFRPEDVAGLFLNIHYREKSLTCTTGTSLRLFTLDHSLDYAWDEMVQKFLRQGRIPFEQSSSVSTR